MAVKVWARRWRRKARAESQGRKRRLAKAEPIDRLRAMVAGLLGLELNDEKAVEAFCQDRLPNLIEYGPIDPFNCPDEAISRLATAQLLVTSVAEALFWGDEERWIRLEAAQRELQAPKPQGIMRLRASVVDAVSFAVWCHKEPLSECPKCLSWTMGETCAEGHDCSAGAQAAREGNVYKLCGSLAEISPAFAPINPDEVAAILKKKTTDTMRAALLSISVQAFGDTGPARKVEKVFAHAWREHGSRTFSERNTDSKVTLDKPAPK